jgi:hypothetical protein
MSETPEGLQAMLDTAGRIATWAGLSFNLKKCATLHIDGKKREAPPTHFRIQEGTPLALSATEVYEHLRVPTSYHAAQSADKALKDINIKLKRIDDSPWLHGKNWMPLTPSSCQESPFTSEMAWYKKNH